MSKLKALLWLPVYFFWIGPWTGLYMWDMEIWWEYQMEQEEKDKDDA